jgi:hypothetical protein
MVNGNMHRSYTITSGSVEDQEQLDHVITGIEQL